MPEPIPPSVNSDGNLTVWLLDATDIADLTSISAALLTDERRVTYSMTPDGFSFRPTTTTEEDPRLALKNVPQTAGSTTFTCTAQYVYGSENDVMDPLVVEGARAIVVARYSVENGEDPEAGQLVDAWAGSWNTPVKDPSTRNSKQTKTTQFLPSQWEPDVELVA